MIDTVKMICPISKSVYDTIIKKSNIKTSYNNDTGDIEYYITVNRLDGSYDYKLQVRPELASKYGILDMNIDYILIVEGSFNKVFKGHNIYGSNNLYSLCSKIVKLIQNEFKIKLLNYLEWYIFQIDFTQSYRIGKNEIDTLNYLNNLKAISYNQRKKVILFDTSIIIKSTMVTKKIYLKYYEFLVHDFKRLKNTIGHELLEFSKNLLRMEASIKVRHLRKMYDKKYVQLKDIKVSDLKEVWRVEFMKYYNVLDFQKYKTVSNEKDVRKRLDINYNPRLSSLLYAFWLECSKFGLQSVRESTKKATFNRKYKQLRDVGIMFGTDLLLTENDYSYNLYHFNPFTEKAI